MAYTKGFRNQIDRKEHFDDHGSDFDTISPEDYERMADAFLGQSLSFPVMECIRKGGDVVRYNPITDEFGVISKDGIIRTYYKPKPRDKKKYPTNIDYWKAQCAR